MEGVDPNDSLNEEDFVFGLEGHHISIAKKYDPFYLRHLPQPQPRDYAKNLTRPVFTFDDALEDLVATHFHGQVVPIERLTWNRLFLDVMFPRGEPPLLQAGRWSLMYPLSRIVRQASVINGSRIAYAPPDPRTGRPIITSQATLGRPGVVVGVNRDITTESPDQIAGRNTVVIGSALTFVQVYTSQMMLGAVAVDPSETELDLANEAARHSRHSSWPSPIEALSSLLYRNKTEHSDSFPGRSLQHRSESQSVVFDENGKTQVSLEEHVDDKGRHIGVVKESKIDHQGNVVSESTKRFVDGKETHWSDQSD